MRSATSFERSGLVRYVGPCAQIRVAMYGIYCIEARGQEVHKGRGQ